MIWVLHKSRTFNTQSLYRFITDGGLEKIYTKIFESPRCPCELVFFGNYTTRKFRQARYLKRKDGIAVIYVHYAKKRETIDHIFFHCTLPNFAWSCLRHVFGWNNISRWVEEVFCFWVEAKPKKAYLFRLFVLEGMALWHNRNKMVFERESEFPCNHFCDPM